ncbi:hypothetical protein Pyn_04320 [Prunus yedoensis var. nudiflora]|uniref:Uncharacterized protein n=1 Tax=Prunus yedoensis var. nudiflora TaxID=2094558 RepID=A0A314UA66_PRUYE|nr:hypothetical protein Pyn_04320 [Prunus yedoensis var. nudiflora]
MRASATADEPTFDSWSLGRYWVRSAIFLEEWIPKGGMGDKWIRVRAVPADSQPSRKAPALPESAPAVTSSPGKAQAR